MGALQIEHAYLKAEFESIFTEHIQRLSEMPITASIIKELYPWLYQQLKKLEVKMDEAWLTFDYEAFTEALREIEEIIKSCQIYEEVENKPEEPEPIQRELNRVCINCGGNLWLILKPKSRTSAIRCVNCNHMEIYIRGIIEHV